MTRSHGLVLLALVVTACLSVRAPRAPEMSGFLDDYSLLREGDPGEVGLVYRNPAADWTASDKVLLEPVTLWRSGRKSLDPVPEEDLLRLIADFEASLRSALERAFPSSTRRGRA